MPNTQNLLSHGISLDYGAFALTPIKREPKLGVSFTRRKETF